MTTLFGNVTDLDLQIRFNASTQKYDCYIVINNGSATTVQQRLQMNSQISFVIPTGLNFSITNRYMPLVSNQAYNGTVPNNWDLSTAVYHPACQPDDDFYGITPALSPSSFYNNITTGDSIKLFSFAVSPLPLCPGDVRLYKEGMDAPSDGEGMNGADFSQGFSIGGVANIYQDNLPPVLPPLVVVNLEDSGLGSLRNCILCANNGTVINFDSSINEDTIHLSSGPIVINKDISMNQAPNSVIKIFSDYNGPVFFVESEKIFHLMYIDILTASSANIFGRAIYNQGTTDLRHVTIFDAEGINTEGSSVYNSGILIMSEDTFIKAGG